MGEENLDFLRHSPLFSGFNEDQFEALVSLAQVQGMGPGRGSCRRELQGIGSSS